jgi:hypothetical protein
MFAKQGAKDPSEATIILIEQAALAVSCISVEELQLEFSSMQRSWSSRELFSGTSSHLKKLVHVNLKEMASQPTFNKFEVFVDEDRKYAQVVALYKSSFTGVRVWRTSEGLFVCGNSAFHGVPEEDEQETTLYKIGILFNIDELESSFYGQAAYQIFFGAIDTRQLVGCTLSDGDTNATLAGSANQYCIAVESLDASKIAEVKNALSMSNAKGLLPLASRFIDSIRVSQEPLVTATNINAAGELVDCQTGWAMAAWKETRERHKDSSSTHKPSSETVNGGEKEDQPSEGKEEDVVINDDGIRCPHCNNKLSEMAQIIVKNGLANNEMLDFQVPCSSCERTIHKHDYRVKRKSEEPLSSTPDQVLKDSSSPRCAKCDLERQGETYSFYYGVAKKSPHRSLDMEMADWGPDVEITQDYVILGEKSTFICDRCAFEYHTRHVRITYLLFIFMTIPMFALLMFDNALDNATEYTLALQCLFAALFFLSIGLLLAVVAYFSKPFRAWAKVYGWRRVKIANSNQRWMEYLSMTLDPPDPDVVYFTTNDYLTLK